MSAVTDKTAFPRLGPGETVGRPHVRYGHSTHGAAHPWVHIIGQVRIVWSPTVVDWCHPEIDVTWSCHRNAQVFTLHDDVPTESLPCPDCFGLRRSESVVYYVERQSRIKVGTTTDLPRRTSALGGQLVATEPGDRLLEGFRHQQFADLRCVGEWFNPGPALVGHISFLRRKADAK